MTPRLAQFRKRLKISGWFFLLVAAFVLIVCWNRIFITTQPGHGGAIWRPLFDNHPSDDQSLGEGLHIIWPWNRIYDYDLRLQNYTTSFDVLTSDGLHVKIGIGFRWRANPRRLGTLRTEYGPNYRDTLIVPSISSITRHVMSRYAAEDLVSGSRNTIQEEIYEEVVATQVNHGIGKMDGHNSKDVVLLEDILISEVGLPAPVERAIEEKLREAQLVEEYRYRLQREELESQRKATEAQGIRRFQEIVASSMSDDYLRWRGIEATLELARSPNSKVVVIGSDKSGGLPLILDAADGKQKQDLPKAAPARKK